MKIPRRVLDINDWIGDRLNYTLYYRGGWLDIRVLDAILAVGFIVFVTHAYLTKGWVAAGQLALMYIFVALCAMWFFPSNKVMK